ncbi:MAG: alginate export family protein [Spirochaetia bacterium]|nr:alginate export family protein [Spirochaetia bacterium]
MKVALFLLFMASGLFAQTQNEPTGPAAQASPEAEKQQPANDAIPETWMDGFRWRALLRFRPEYRGNYDFDKTTDDHQEFVGQKIQFGFERDFFEDVTAHVTVQDSRVWGGEPGSKTGAGTANDATGQSTDIRTAWLEMRDLGPFEVRLGRQLFKLGEERLVGGSDWGNVGRSFDGLSVKLNSSWYQGQVLGAVLSEEDSDSASNVTHVGPKNSSGFVYTCDSVTSICTVTAKTIREQGDAYMGSFYNTFLVGDLGQIEAYYIGVYKKWIQRTSPLAIPLAELMSQDRERQRDNRHTFGGRITNRMGPKRESRWEFPLDWSIEYDIQRGQSGRRIDASWDYLRTTLPTPTGGTVRAYTEKERYNAFAFNADAGYTFAKLVRVGGAYSVASGDRDRTDGVASTFYNLFPSNHALYGQADMISLQNMIGKSANVTFLMGKYGKLKLAGWTFSKHKLQDAWYDGNGTARTGESTESLSDARYAPLVDASGYRAAGELRRHLLKEYDLTYVVMYHRIEFGLGYSAVRGGDSIREVKNDTLNTTLLRKPRFDPRADFGYFMMTMAF